MWNLIYHCQFCFVWEDVENEKRNLVHSNSVSFLFHSENCGLRCTYIGVFGICFHVSFFSCISTVSA